MTDVICIMTVWRSVKKLEKMASRQLGIMTLFLHAEPNPQRKSGPCSISLFQLRLRCGQADYKHSLRSTANFFEHKSYIMARPRRFPNPALFVCDIQEKFRPAIYEYPKVISTASKMISACNTLSIPIYATTQSAAKLGPTCSELTGTTPLFTVDKTAFSMMVPELREALSSASPYEPFQVAIVGIETHICVTQTALDLLREGHKVYIITDGVSSCNEGERGVALARLRAEGVIVTTSESWLYECMGDAGIAEYAVPPPH